MSDEVTNLLVMPSIVGIISDEQVKEFGLSIFHCGRCSAEGDERVYHNVIGQHRHHGWRRR